MSIKYLFESAIPYFQLRYLYIVSKETASLSNLLLAIFIIFAYFTYIN